MLFSIVLLVSSFYACSSAGDGSTTVAVQVFTPEPIHITVNDLPAPFQTSSARKPSSIAPVPANATLLVPDPNFRVTVYREAMKSPRQMIYTPTGDILVTELRGSQISILSANDTSIFADVSNGISRAFGMAFVEVISRHSCFRSG